MSISAQFYTGYYVSDPEVHSFHHFKIHQDRDESGKLKGDLHIKAYNEDTYLWEQVANHVNDQHLYRFFIQMYSHEEDIIFCSYFEPRIISLPIPVLNYFKIRHLVPPAGGWLVTVIVH